MPFYYSSSTATSVAYTETSTSSDAWLSVWECDDPRCECKQIKERCKGTCGVILCKECMADLENVLDF